MLDYFALEESEMLSYNLKWICEDIQFGKISDEFNLLFGKEILKFNEEMSKKVTPNNLVDIIVRTQLDLFEKKASERKEDEQRSIEEVREEADFYLRFYKLLKITYAVAEQPQNDNITERFLPEDEEVDMKQKSERLLDTAKPVLLKHILEYTNTDDQNKKKKIEDMISKIVKDEDLYRDR